MIPVSSKWGNTILNPDVSRKFSETAIISLGNGINQPTAVGIETSGAQSISKDAQLYDSILSPGYPYADADGTWTIGSGRMVASVSTGENGFVGNSVCDANGYFSPYVWVRMKFNAEHSINTIFLAFDDELQQYATQFDIVFWNKNNQIIGRWAFNENQRIVFNPMTAEDASATGEWQFILGQTSLGNRLGQGTGELPNLTGVFMAEIRIYKWSQPNTTAKIIEFSAEQNEIVRGDDRIINVKIDMELMPDNIQPGYVPSQTLTMTLDNGDNRYTPNNSDGIIGGEPMSNKRIAFFCGLEYDDGTSEQIQCGTFYIDTWTVNQAGKIVTIQASDIISRLDNIEYIKTDGMSYPADLKSMAEDVFNCAGFSIAVNVEPPYEQVIVNTEPDWGDGITCRAAMQHIASRVNGQILQRWDGGIWGYAQISDNEDTYFNWTAYIGGYERYLTQDGYFNLETVDYDKSRTINACQVYYGPENGNQQTYWLYTDNVNKYGTNLFTLDRTPLTTLITQSTEAEKICRGILGTYSYFRQILKLEYRGDPAIELRDCVVVRSMDEKDLWGLVTKKSMEFDGGYRETLEVLH